jgi:hypothetical protein
MSTDMLTVIFVLVAVAFLAGVYGERWRARDERRKWWKAKRGAQGASVTPFKPRTNQRQANLDATDQLRIVMEATFEPRPLMSKAEARVFYAAERAIRLRKLSWRVMAQVNLGEILSSPDARAYAAINSKRVDVLLVSNRGEPIAAIEYQGGGHFQGTAPARDAVKREALRRAGVRYIEMTPEHDAEDLAREIDRIPTAASQAER